MKLDIKSQDKRNIWGIFNLTTLAVNIIFSLYLIAYLNFFYSSYFILIICLVEIPLVVLTNVNFVLNLVWGNCEKMKTIAIIFYVIATALYWAILW